MSKSRKTLGISERIFEMLTFLRDERLPSMKSKLIIDNRLRSWNDIFEITMTLVAEYEHMLITYGIDLLNIVNENSIRTRIERMLKQDSHIKLYNYRQQHKLEIIPLQCQYCERKILQTIKFGSHGRCECGAKIFTTRRLNLDKFPAKDFKIIDGFSETEQGIIPLQLKTNIRIIFMKFKASMAHEMQMDSTPLDIVMDDTLQNILVS